MLLSLMSSFLGRILVVYITFLVKRDHPYLEEILAQFDQFVTEMKEKPHY